MPPLDRILWRLVAASLGFLVAVAASIAVVLAAAALLPTLDFAAADMNAGAVATGFYLVVQRGVLLLPIFAHVVWPAWLVAALLAEVGAVRALAAHLFVPPLLAAVAVFVLFEAPPGPALRLMIAASLVAGFAHWLVAGRSAGFAMRSAPDSGRGDPRPPHA